MMWLYVQTWLWYLVAFGAGVGLAWLVLVRPQQRRLARLGADATPAVPDGERAGTNRTETERPGSDPGTPGDRAGDPTGTRPDGAEAATELLPAVDSALSLLDSRLGFGRIAAGTDAAAAMRDLATDPASPRPAGNPPPET